MVRRCLETLEQNRRFRVSCYGEPCLGKRGLYPTLSQKNSASAVKTMMDFLAYADGRNDLISIADIIGVPVSDILPIVSRLKEAGLISEIDQ